MPRLDADCRVGGDELGFLVMDVAKGLTQGAEPPPLKAHDGRSKSFELIKYLPSPTGTGSDIAKPHQEIVMRRSSADVNSPIEAKELN